MKKMQWALAGAAMTCALAGAVRAEQTVIYSNDFEKGNLGAEWGANKTTTKAANFTRFLGRYSQFDAVKLKLPVPSELKGFVLPPGKSLQYGVTFDFYCIDSWDGSDPVHGKDYFQVLVDGTQWFSETFANVHKWQTFREPDVGRKHLGFSSQWEDSIYRDITVPFTVDEWRQDFSITFRSRYLSSMDDESWGIDNVRVWYEIVPAPGAGAAMALAGAAGLRRRRY